MKNHFEKVRVDHKFSSSPTSYVVANNLNIHIMNKYQLQSTSTAAVIFMLNIGFRLGYKNTYMADLGTYCNPRHPCSLNSCDPNSKILFGTRQRKHSSYFPPTTTSIIVLNPLIELPAYEFGATSIVVSPVPTSICNNTQNQHLHICFPCTQHLLHEPVNLNCSGFCIHVFHILLVSLVNWHTDQGSVTSW